AGVGPQFAPLIADIRRVWPRFMYTRVLMIGCAAGEGHLAGDHDRLAQYAEVLAASAARHARGLGARLIVLQEVPARYRSAVGCSIAQGFTRIPSLPMTRLSIDYASFDDYMNRALNSATRKKLRKKFRATEQVPIEMSMVRDVSPVVAQVYPLYL